MSDDIEADRAAALLKSGRLSIRAEDLSNRELALIMAATPTNAGSEDYTLESLPDVETGDPAAAQSQAEGDTPVERWWVRVDGGDEMQPADVMRGSPFADLQDPPQPWHAHVIGSEEILWPDRVRLVRKIPGVGAPDIHVTLVSDSQVVVRTRDGAMRIVAGPESIAAAAGKRVAELVTEAIEAREREKRGSAPAASPEFLASIRAGVARLRALKDRSASASTKGKGDRDT